MMHIAAGSEGSKCLKFLIEKGENVNALSNEYDRATPLHFAVMAANVENTKWLLKKNANPNAKDSVTLPFTNLFLYRLVTPLCIWQ